jgi:hypothetical protein
MKELLEKLVKSFDNQPGGFSSRKLSAFVIIVCVIIAHIKWISFGDFSQLETILTIDYTFISTMLGLTTYQAIQNKKNETKTE